MTFTTFLVLLPCTSSNSPTMEKKTSRANHGFLLGSFILIILLFLTVFIFLMWAYKAFQKQETAKSYQQLYEIALDESTLGHPMMLYINDSLIFSGTPSATMTLSVGRFEEESTILAVDSETDQVSLIALPDESIRLTIHRDDSQFSAD